MIVNSSKILWLFFGNFTILFSAKRVLISTDLAERKYSYQNATICAQVLVLFYSASPWHFKLIFGYFNCLSKTIFFVDFTSVDRSRSIYSLAWQGSVSRELMVRWNEFKRRHWRGVWLRLHSQRFQRHLRLFGMAWESGALARPKRTVVHW